jgi:hypothetical protein
MDTTPEAITLVQEGHYVDLYELPSGELRMKLKEGLEGDYREDVLVPFNERGLMYAFEILFDDFACNGWDIYDPNEIGALTDRLMFGCELAYKGDSEVIESIGKVYYDDELGTSSFIEILYAKGYYDFKFVVED